VPLHSLLVQLAPHALLHSQMRNLVCLSIRLLPTSLLLPQLQDSLSYLSCLQHLSLQFEQCGSDGSISIMRSLARLPLLHSLQLQGLDLSVLLVTSARFSMTSPISSISFRGAPPPHVAAAGSSSGAAAAAAAAMPLSPIARVVSACASTLQSLVVAGKQQRPHEQEAGGWRLLLHATVHCALLQALDVSRSGIDAVGCVGLACCLQRLPLLHTLDVSCNPLAAALATPGAADMVSVGAGFALRAAQIAPTAHLSSFPPISCYAG
jgi:hypothetical protein